MRCPALFAALLALAGCDGLDVSRYERVIADIQRGALVAPTSGALKLPARFASVTPRDEVFVERKPDGRLLVLFPTWYGQGANLDGYLYCSGPLEPADFYAASWDPDDKRQCLDVGGLTRLSVQTINPHWHSVDRRLD